MARNDLEKFETATVLCEGGLDSNRNHLMLSMKTPGAASDLVNFEPSLFGGYRRISGFEPLESLYAEVDSAGAEGKIFGVAFYNGNIIAARKSQGSAVYKFYKWDPGLVWDDYATGLTLTSTNVDKIRNTTFNFDGTEKIVFVDGVNKASIYNNSAWVVINSAATGLDYANAGGPNALPAPKYITVFKNHVFVSGDETDPNVIAHSAPNAEYDWLTASGAGQLVAGFAVKQLKVFRDELYVFGATDIKKVVEESNAFVLKDVTNNIGCLASDSVVEINGDLLFLSQDGIRTIAATERVNDIEIGNQAKKIQQDLLDFIEDANLSQVNALVVRRKSQVRYFFSAEASTVASNVGIIGGLRGGNDVEHTGTAWEWGKLLGIRTSCCASEYIDNEEYVIHGDYNGKVYRQEMGNDFDGANITAAYTTPFLDFGDVFTRKTMHKIIAFVRPEGVLSLSTTLTYDWDSAEVLNPATYLLEEDVSGAVYGVAVYGTGIYVNTTTPLLVSNVEGSGMSTQVTFTTSGTGEAYSIQALVFEYSVNGRK